MPFIMCESEESRPERAGLTTETLLCSAEFVIRLWNKWEFAARPSEASEQSSSGKFGRTNRGEAAKFLCSYGNKLP
jgi:hypothetical protein